MVTLKLLGVLLILGTGGAAALLSARHEQRRLWVLEAWIDLIFYIRGQIDCYLMPLEDILARADLQRLHTCVGTDQRSLPDLLRSSSPFLDSEGKRLLESFVRELGGSYREEQVRRCEHYLQALQKQRDALFAKLPAKIKVSATLCICLAVGTAILLW